jgi:hypothetical protein
LTTLLVFAEAAAVSPHALLLESTPSADTTVIRRHASSFDSTVAWKLASPRCLLIGGPRQMRMLLLKNEAAPEQPDMLIYTVPSTYSSDRAHAARRRYW